MTARFGAANSTVDRPPVARLVMLRSYVVECSCGWRGGEYPGHFTAQRAKRQHLKDAHQEPGNEVIR